MATKWLSVLSVLAPLAFATTACSHSDSSSEVMAMARTTKTLHLKEGAQGASSGEFIKFSEMSYTIYETGRIDLHGDVSFSVPLIGYEIDLPFTKTYYTNAKNVLSDSYKKVTAAEPLQVDRLAVDVVGVSDDAFSAKVKAQINRSFYWTDLFWGFDLLTMDLDLTGKVVDVSRIEVKKGYVYYDAIKRRILPSLYPWQDDNGDDDDDDDGDDDDDFGPVFFPQLQLADDDDLEPSEIIERESNDATKFYNESKLIFE